MKSNRKFRETESGMIPEDWDVLRIGDLVKINETVINKHYPERIIEYMDTSSVDNGRLIGTQVLILEEAPSRAKRIVKDNDILISTVRPNLKHFFFLNKAKRNLVVSTGFAVVSAKSINPKFLYYYLTTDTYTKFLSSIADSHTSTYPSFNPDVIEDSFCPVPSDNEQSSIAKILSSLDSKIELLQEQNKTLEAIGQALFKHWFVDFEFPDENGKPYKSNGGKMVKSEIGMIPGGWKAGDLGSISKNIKEGKKTEDIDPNTPYISLEHMPQRRISLSEWTNAEGIGSNKFCFKKNHILFGKLRPYFHKVGIAPVSGVCSTDILVIAPSQEHYGYVLFLISSTEFVNYADKASTGTKMPRATWGYMEKYSCVIPPKSVSMMFTEIVQRLTEKMNISIHEIRDLTIIRDSLLPKLMSGKIRVPVEVP